MDKVLQSLKILFKCESPFKRHLKYLLLLVLPSVVFGILEYIDKDTPKSVLIALAIATAVVCLLAVVPTICTFGFSIKFIKDRFDNVLGIPELSFDMLKKGLKYLPIFITWSLYFLIFFALIISGTVAFIINLGVMLSSSVFGMVTIVLFPLLAALIILAISILIIPFTVYIIIGFAKDEKYRSEYFNPLILFSYMKKAFKETFVVAVKFYLAGLVVNLATGLLSGSLIVASVLVVATAVVLSPANSDNAIYQPFVMAMVILLTSVSVLVQMYGNSLVGFAAMENYLDVYKDKIEDKELTE